MNETINTILSRRTCRSFSKTEKMKDEDLKLIVKAALHAPSAMNLQDWHLTVIRNPALLDELNTIIMSSADPVLKARIEERAGGGKPSFFYSSEALILVSLGTKTSYPEGDCGCAMQNMMLAAASLNIGSCWINQLKNMSGKKEVRAFLDEVGVPAENCVYACLALGVPEKLTDIKNRKPDTVNYID